MKLPERSKPLRTYNLHISDFLLRSSGISSATWLPHYKSLGKYWNCSFWSEHYIIRSQTCTILFLRATCITQYLILCINGILWRHVWRHMGHLSLSKLLINNSRPNWARETVKASMCSQWTAESNDMQHDLLSAISWPDQHWPDLDLIPTCKLTFPKQKLYHSTRSIRQTRW